MSQNKRLNVLEEYRIISSCDLHAGIYSYALQQTGLYMHLHVQRLDAIRTFLLSHYVTWITYPQKAYIHIKA